MIMHIVHPAVIMLCTRPRTKCMITAGVRERQFAAGSRLPATNSRTKSLMDVGVTP